MRPEASKLLSHRLRGFGAIEHTREALKSACAADVAYLEVDTRASCDGKIYVSHDDSTRRYSQRALRYSTTDASVLDEVRTRTGAPLLTLDHTLLTFRERARAHQRIVLDIKDFGYEEQHLALVRKHVIEERTVFVSWIPQCLSRLHELGARTPLILSHWNLARLGAAGRTLSRVLERRLDRAGPLVLIGAGRIGDPLGRLAQGFQHGLVCSPLPAALATTLARSGGGICVHTSMLGERLTQACTEASLKLWVFTASRPAHFRELARNPHVAVVFSDDAPAVLAAPEERVR